MNWETVPEPLVRITRRRVLESCVLWRLYLLLVLSYNQYCHFQFSRMIPPESISTPSVVAVSPP